MAEPTPEDRHPGPVDRRVADLLAVLDVTRRLGSEAELQPLLEAIERAALAVLDCERASVFLHDPAAGELVSRVATGGVAVRFPADRGVAGAAFRHGVTVNVPDAYADPRFNPEIDRLTGFLTRNLLSCPLRGWDDSVVGVLQALNRRDRPFDAWDETLASALAAQAGVAVQRQVLLEGLEAKRIYERELGIARRVQQGLLPRTAPEVPGYDVAGWNRPADATGGDVYDFKRLPDGRLALLVADASGHGLGPALVIAQFRALVRAALARDGEPDRVAAAVNALLCDDLPDDRFVTAFFGLLDPASHRLRLASAAHAPILLYRPGPDEVVDLARDCAGLPAGVDADAVYGPPAQVELEPGDLLVVLTDGFIEWSARDHTLFGFERLAGVVRRHHALPAADLIDQLQRAVLAFADGTPQADDLTAVVVKRRP